MQTIKSFDEWLRDLCDYNQNGKIDKAAEKKAYKKALNNRNSANTQQAFAEYVALMEAANKNERAHNENLALIKAAGEGNAAAATVLTGNAEGKTATNITMYVVFAAVGIVAIVLLMRKK